MMMMSTTAWTTGAGALQAAERKTVLDGGRMSQGYVVPDERHLNWKAHCFEQFQIVPGMPEGAAEQGWSYCLHQSPLEEGTTESPAPGWELPERGEGWAGGCAPLGVRDAMWGRKGVKEFLTPPPHLVSHNCEKDRLGKEVATVEDAGTQNWIKKRRTVVLRNKKNARRVFQEFWLF